MNTKIVYVVASSLSDYYLEQAWVSIWSAKYYNPDAKIVMVTDKETQVTTQTKERSGILSIISEIVSVEFDSNISNKERSRWLKTKLRDLVEGDFLFIDTDTIITDKLSEIDEWEIPLGMVLDLHTETATFPNQINAWIKKLLDYDFQVPNYHYFNSGLIYAKDCSETHDFYERWHENWKVTKGRGALYDQPSLNKVNDELGGNAISVLPGIYNCQIHFSIRYLHQAKIIHFAMAPFYGRKASLVSPFQGNSVFKKVREKCGIGDDIAQTILNCKSEFSIPSIPIDMDEFLFLNSQPCRSLKKVYMKWPQTYHLFEIIINKGKKLFRR